MRPMCNCVCITLGTGNFSVVQFKYSINKLQAGGRHDMLPPRPASGDTIYVMYAYGQVTITACPCWPASITNQSGLVTLTFDILTLKVVFESRVTWATYVPILVFLGLSVLELGQMYATDRQTSDRQTLDVRQKHRLMPPPITGDA